MVKSLLWALMLVTTSLWAQIQVSLSDSKPQMEEPFDIIFSTTQTGHYTPDISPLNEHFKVLNQQFSQSSKYINGESSNEIQWIITVLPKKVGANQIPAISFGGDSSESLQFEVAAASTVKKTSNEDGLFLKVESQPSNTVKGGQSIVTVKLYSAYPLQNANMSQLESNYKNDLVVFPLGGVSQRATVENNRSYEVFEQRYAVFASKTGNVVLPPIQVTAEIIDLNKQRSWFGIGTQTLQVSSAPLTLHVIEPKETGYAVVAHDLKLTTSLSGAPYEVNSPITLTVGLKALGTPVNQLKAVIASLELQLKERGLQYYMDTPESSQDVSKEGIKSSLVQKIAIIPQTVGPMEISSFSIKWLNALTLSTQTLVMKPYTFDIAPASGIIQAESTPAEGSVSKASDAPNYWMYASALLATLWILSYLVSPLKNLLKRKSSTSVKKPPVAVQKALQQALKENSLAKVEVALLDWAKLQGLEVKSLLELADYFEDFEEDIKAFHAARFNPKTKLYSPQAFLKRFIPVMLAYKRGKSKKTSNTESKLPPLYPSM